MPEMTPQVSDLLEKALALSTKKRGLLIDHLIKSLDEGPPDEGVEQAWSEEIKCRVGDVRSGRVAMIPGDEVRRRLGRRLLHGPRVNLSEFIHSHGKTLTLRTSGISSVFPKPATR